MYETLMYTLRAFLGIGILRISLIASLAFTVLVLAANASAAFREGFGQMRERKGWRGSLAGLGAGIFKLLLIFVLTRLLITALVYQAGIFEQQHGRITERNRSAVLMKWGYPHEQRELSVSHTRKRIWVNRQLQVQGEDGKVFSESFWRDEESPIEAVGGKLPILISIKEEERDVSVAQKSILSADVDITVTNNPRKLGNANYAGYDDVWELKYVIGNRSQWKTTAHMSFPLPARTGLFDEMYLRVDGVSILDLAKSETNALKWGVEMPSGSQSVVEIGYKSRGLEHLRYIPKRMSPTGHYRVKITVNGIPPDKLDYPIGSMPPVENLNDIKETSYTLTWKLDNALTSYDIGIKLPVAEQPAYHFARLLEEAPVGLILLFVLLIVPAVVIPGQRVRPEFITILGAIYCLHYTFMGRLADLMTGFAGPFVISAVVVVAIIGWFRLSDTRSRLLRTQDAAVFAITAVLYPLAIVDTDRTAFWLQLFYLGVLTYSCILLILYRVLPSKQGKHA